MLNFNTPTPQADSQLEQHHTNALPNDFESLQEAAKTLDAQSLYLMGIAYETGNGVAKNINLAFAAFRAAAERNHLGAGTKAALILLASPEPSTNIGWGISWLKAAAAKDYPEALYTMALLHNNGHFHPSIERNQTLALELIVKSARIGYTPAQKMILKNNLPVDLEPNTALKWVGILAINGDKEAEVIYVQALKNAGLHNHIEPFLKTVLLQQSLKQIGKSNTISQPASATMNTQENPMEAPVKVLTPQLLSEQQKAKKHKPEPQNEKKRKAEQDNAIEMLSSAVGKMAVNETNQQAEPAVPASLKSKKPKK